MKSGFEKAGEMIKHCELNDSEHIMSSICSYYMKGMQASVG
jgi:hypothetical protein